MNIGLIGINYIITVGCWNGSREVGTGSMLMEVGESRML